MCTGRITYIQEENNQSFVIHLKTVYISGTIFIVFLTLHLGCVKQYSISVFTLPMGREKSVQERWQLKIFNSPKSKATNPSDSIYSDFLHFMDKYTFSLLRVRSR